jgi:PKHD-type hydroxylase
MQHLLTPQASNREIMAWWEGAFNDEQLNWLQQKAKEATTDAQVGSSIGGVVDANIRRSELNWLEKTEETAWVFDGLGHVVSNLNSSYFGFDLMGFAESLQLTNYHEDKRGMYGWHQDFGKTGPCRKLSLVMQLSDPSEYEGGTLEIMTSGSPQVVEKKRGLITVFPSWTLHQVTPVVRGTRQTLVTWICGPDFK